MIPCAQDSSSAKDACSKLVGPEKAKPFSLKTVSMDDVDTRLKQCALQSKSKLVPFPSYISHDYFGCFWGNKCYWFTYKSTVS